MGAEVCVAPQAALGEPVIEIAAAEAYRLWSASYDDALNPLLALEGRVVSKRLDLRPGYLLLDAACGTGRWALHALSEGANALAFDASPQMLAIAAQKRSLDGRIAIADMSAIPVADAAAEVAICSFALSYVESVGVAIAELGRVARRVVISDLHPLATAAGWSRSFRSGEQVYRIRSYAHSLSSIEKAARDAGMRKCWELEARFGAPEEEIFRAAGKEEQFHRAREIPAIFAQCWEHP